MTTELLNIELIRTDGGTQSRAGLYEKTLATYVDDLRNGDQFPPVDVVYDGQHYWLYDGYHRHEAHRRAGSTQIAANVHQGDQAEAQWRSYAANPTHGLQRTQEDKERAVKAALRHPKAASLSDSSLAKYLHVSDKTVTKYRRELEAAGEIAALTVRTGADGRTINTANIGTNRPAPATASKELPPDSSDQIMPIVAEWLRKYTDQSQHTWRDIATVVTNTNAKQYADIAAYVRLRGLRFNDVVLTNAIYAALTNLDRNEAPPPTSETPKSVAPPSIPLSPSVPTGIIHIPTYLSAAGCQIQSMGNGTYKIFIPLGPDALDSLTTHGPIGGTHAAVTEMARLARQRGLLTAAGVELGITKATELIWASLSDREFKPSVLPAKIAFTKNADLAEFRRFLAAGETVTDETLQAAIGKVEAALLLAVDHCRHPATVAATGRCIDCGLLMDDETASPPPASTAEREITETLDKARRLRTRIADLLDIIEDYGELTGNDDAPAAAIRVLQPMLNKLEILAGILR